MGDRVNVRIKDSSGAVVIYGHWSGNQCPAHVAQAIRFAEPRWSDSSYCARAIVHSLMNTMNSDSETDRLSCGLTLGPDVQVFGDGYPLLEIDVEDQVVLWYAEEGSDEPGALWSFGKYLEMNPILWGDLLQRNTNAS